MQKNYSADQSVIDEVERTTWKKVLITLGKDWRLYVLLIPVIVFLICFNYLPLSGILLGFKADSSGQAGAPYESYWSGFTFMSSLFNNTLFWRAFRNTFVNSMYGLIIGFPLPIILALLFSEIKSPTYRSFLQISCYLPHFVSLVVVTSLIALWCNGSSSTSDGGALFQLCVNLGLTDKAVVGAKGLMTQAKFFRPIYQISDIWETAGYSSIVYFAAICAISPTNYEAARIDGASKLQQIRYVTFPGMAPTLTIMLIMRLGQIFNTGYEKVVLLIGNADSGWWETGDVVSSFVYRQREDSGYLQGIPQIGIVADLFNSFIALFLVLGANAISRRVSSTSLF